MNHFYRYVLTTTSARKDILWSYKHVYDWVSWWPFTEGHQYPKNYKSAKKAQRDVTGAIEKSLLLYDEDNVNDDEKDMAQQEIPLISQDIPLEDIPENSD